MHNARRPGGPVAAANKCAAHGPLSVATRDRSGIEYNLEDGVRTRLRRELDARLERMLEEICLSGVHSSLAFGALAPDGVPPESDKTASARCRSPANTS